MVTKTTLIFVGRIGEYGPLNWPITACVLTERYNKDFERPKIDACEENRLEALKAFKKKCRYIFKGSLVNILEERKCILGQG